MNLQSLKGVTKNALAQLLNSFSAINCSLSAQDIAYLERISIASPYATQQIIIAPQIYIDWLEFIEKKAIFDPNKWSIDKGISDEGLIKQQLRKYRHYGLCHIILNDVCLNYSVPEILNQISALAYKLIALALDSANAILVTKHGQPINEKGHNQSLMIMAMGKLGGGELNFSSDIDLIFVYANDGELSGQGNLSYREFFTRVGRLFTKFLNETTQSGFVYRVDLRLRPWGDSGPLVINLAGLENYYQHQGRDWERYALVKAQVITGSAEDKASLQQVINPFVYRKYQDFNVFAGLGRLKQQIDQEARKKGESLNIKLCSGGIREIEFCIQALQILQGGRHKNLQVTSILKMFERAKQEEFYSVAELKVLKKTYVLLRLVENRIQMLNDQQTHDLPINEEDQARLLHSLQIETWSELVLKIEVALLQVSAIFKQLFIEQIQASGMTDFTQFNEQQWVDYCAGLFKEDSVLIAKHLNVFFKERTVLAMSNKGKERLNDLLPNFLEIIAEYDSAKSLLYLLTDLLLSIARRSVYLEMLSMHRPLLQKVVNLFAKSQWLAEEVIRFPILLESVLTSEQNIAFNKQEVKTVLKRELQQIKGDVELELDVLRVFKRQHLFYIALQEIEGFIQPLEASGYLSELAEIILQASYDINLSQLVAQFGEPQYELDGKQHFAQFGIIAYGKLGGKELHYTSDLDVIFLHNSCAQKQMTNGKKTIDNAQFFVRLAQKITQSISLMTSSGRVYEIDARLRPNGASGFLVSSIEAFYQYQKEKAWVWEHQALVRARFAAGNEALNAAFKKVKCDVLEGISSTPDLANEVSTMRQKMLLSVKSSSPFNVKKSRGGMIDVEFMVQYLVLINANKISSLCEYSANIALLKHLHKCGCLNDEFLALINIYQNLHLHLHKQVMQQSVQDDISDQMQKDIDTVMHLWRQCFNNS